LEQFTYIVSHNLRAPIANILGSAEAFRTLDLAPDEKEDLMFSLSASTIKLNGVIEDLNHILQTKRNISEKRETVSFSHLIKNRSAD
jgi:signal transduction histidine kinase